MRYDFQLLLFFAIVGMVFRRLGWKAWLSVATLTFVWIMYNWKRA